LLNTAENFVNQSAAGYFAGAWSRMLSPHVITITR
jgi:hypothetical protein